MEIPSYFKKSYCDQIVGDRNRAFGQYDLRVTYPNRMHKAQLWVLLSAISIITVLEWFSKPVEATLPLASNAPVVFREVEIPIYEMPKPKAAEASPTRKVEAAKIEKPAINLSKPLEINNDKQADKTLVDSSLFKPIPEGKTTGAEGAVGMGKDGEAGAKPGAGPGSRGDGPEGSSITRDEFGTSPIDVPEILPEFQGDLQHFFARNTRYPNDAVNDGVEGQVFVVFIVDEKGKVSKPEILKGIRADCDNEALRVVKAMPDWVPGTMSGKPVKVRMRIPVKFKLAR